MTKELTASDWHDIFDEARDEAGLDDEEPVPDEPLRSTVRYRFFEPDVTDRVERALDKGWIEAHEREDTRVYTHVESDAQVGIDRFLGSPDQNSDWVQECLSAAVDYYHANIINVQRDWIREQWGLGDEVIDELRIGWADSTNDLIDHLRGRDFSDAEIARAGLATSNALKHVYRCHEEDCSHYDAPDVLDDLRDARIDGEIAVEEIDPVAVVEYAVDEGWHELYDWWDKRVVFPYYDEAGDARYLIARRTHASDDVQGKYLKLQVRPHTDNEAVYEPIYGVHDYDSGGDLILTEGITDAIWAHHRGLDCLAPVTKQFKRDHLDDLVSLAEDAERVYLCNDAEETSTGLEAALRTADHLADEGIDVQVAELPRDEDEEKLDLADYLAEHTAADLREEVLTNAVAPGEHPMYDEAVENDERDGGDEDYDAPATSSDRDSALFTLSLKEVVEQDSKHGVRGGYRGDNPIDHVGSSHSDYFVYERKDGEMRARDFKSEHSYTPLTWLACAAGVRDTESPGGRFDDAEIYECWKYAKEQGMIADDDPVPYRVVRWLAEREGLVEEDYPVQEEGLPAASYNAVLTLIEQEYGYDPGRDTVGDARDAKAGEAKVEAEDEDDEDEQIIKSLMGDMR